MATINWYMQGAREGFNGYLSDLPIDRQISLSALAWCLRNCETMNKRAYSCFASGYKDAVNRKANRWLKV